ncbi:hypothetical protein WJR50_15425 [Catalinimonas sp. 4WD22]|uniref:hypothetical protein n=1 Tax=Catalinimonas locisalis TaxID=3133978 RepID=UPI003101032B
MYTVRFLCLAVCLLLGFQANAQEQPQVEKLAVEAVNPSDVKIAEDLANQILGKMAEGSYYAFTEEDAIPQIIDMFTEDMQKQAYQQIKAQVGNYEGSMDFQEAYEVSQTGMEATIFRFKGNFSQSEPEVRVVINREDQLMGLRVLPWSDEMK